MATQDFHILMQCGCLYKNVKVLTEHGYASTSAEVYWNLKSKGYIYVLKKTSNTPEKVYIDDIYKFCASDKYAIKKLEENSDI